MHGSLWPEVGSIDLTKDVLYGAYDGVNPPQPPTWAPGLFAGQVPQTSFSSAQAAVPFTTGSSILVEGWVETDAAAHSTLATWHAMNGVNTNESAVEFQLQSDASGHLRVSVVSIRRNSGGFVTGGPTAYSTAAAGWHQVTVWFLFTGAATATVTVWLDGVLQSPINLTGLSAWSHNGTEVFLSAISPVDSWQATVGEASPLPVVFQPGAVLDASLNPLTAIPDVAGVDVWSVVQQIAEAEQGVAGFDETGIFRFYNRDTLHNAVSVRTVTPTYSLKTLNQELGLSFIVNRVQIPVNALQVQPFSTVWSATDVIAVAPNSTYSTVVTTNSPVVNVALTTSVIPSGGLTLNMSGYRASRRSDGGNGAVSNLTMTVTQLSPSTIAVSVRNPNNFYAFLCSPSGAGFPASSNGLPALSIGGQNVTSSGTATDLTSASSGSQLVDVQFPAAQDGGAASSPRGEKLLLLASNPWIQDTVAATAFANSLLQDLYKPRPLWRDVQIVADPTLQLTDRITVIDPETTMISDDAYIFGVHTTVSATSWDQTLDLRSISTPGGWLLGVPGRSELGVATYV
jgi:hypothetical protein